MLVKKAWGIYLNRHRTKKYALFCILIFYALTLRINGQEALQLDFTSKYIWRGFDVLDDKPALQPSISFDLFGLYLNVWGSFALKERDWLRPLDEIDVTLSYNFQLSDEFSIEAGVIHYGWYWEDNFSFKDSTTWELFVSAKLTKLLFAPSITVFHDFKLGKGTYVLLQGEYSLEMRNFITLNFSASLGYNAKMWINTSGFSDLNFGVSSPIKLGSTTISPFINYTIVFLESVNENNEVWFGISLAL